MIWPFENDTTGIEKKLAVKSLSANRKRNFFVGIIILISGFLLSFMVILLCNATINMKESSQVDNSTQMLGTVAGIVILLLFTAGLANKKHCICVYPSTGTGLCTVKGDWCHLSSN